jgi:predicted PurR-regulated permease PerM
MRQPFAAQERVPVRTIATAIGMVLATWVLLQLVLISRRVLVWALIAAFFAVALHPLVTWVERRVRRRWLATLLVFVVTGVLLAALVAAFVVPLAREATQLASHADDYYRDLRSGRGPLGSLVRRYNIDQWLTEHEPQLRAKASGLSTPALHAVQTAAQTLAGILTIAVLAYLMVLQAPKVVEGTLALLPDDRRRERVRRVGSDCARTITGYLSGNLLISVICGLLTFVVLLALHIPFAGLIALFVAVVDLVPLIGATLGAIVAAAAGFVHSLAAGIILIVFFIVYQQLENHLLQPVIYSRTVQLNPLTVLLAILLAVELAGILGALLAIPIAGIIQVVVRDVWDSRHGQLKPEPTVGEEEEPVDEAAVPAPPDQGK